MSDPDFSNRNAVYAEAIVEPERGRWGVYLEVGFWEPNQLDNLQIVRRRIQDYAKKRQAEVAAHWIERAARKELPQPPTGL